jgi:hypothetical protein
MMEEEIFNETISDQEVVTVQEDADITVESESQERNMESFSSVEHRIEEENQLFTDVPLTSLHYHPSATMNVARPTTLTEHNLFGDINHQQHQHVIDKSNVKSIAEELFPSKTASRDAGDLSFSSFHDRSFFGKLPNDQQGVHNPFE